MRERKDVKQAIQEVHNAAIEQSLDSVSELVVDKAKKLVGADNGRLRFVDYTERKLVPGAIRGALAEKPEMAVRIFKDGKYECIVGRAAAKQITQFVDDVQNDPDFKTFKEKVKKKGEKDNNWQVYHDQTLAKLGSEIAVPVLAGRTLLGVLSVNAQEKQAFQKEYKALLSTFAREIAVAFLNRKLGTVRINV